MKKIDRIIYTLSLILLAAELGVMIISILAKPLSDTYLRVWGIITIVTLLAALYGFIRKRASMKKEM